jgi:ankyrin repeat protein
MNAHSRTDLHTAASEGNLDLVRRLIADGENVDRLDADGLTALYFAAAGGHPQVVQFLLESGADPDGLTLSDARNSATVGSESSTAEQSNEEQFDDGDEDDDDDEFDDESYNDDEDEDEDEEADEESEGGQRGVPLLEALHHQDRTASAEVVRLLLSAGANVNARGDDLATPLMVVAWAQWPEMVDALLAAGADPNLADEEGTTPLLAALSVDDDRAAVTRIVHVLLAAGADIQQADEEGQTSLMLAAAYGHVELVRTLLEMGADADAEDHQERNALVRAAETLANLAEIGTDAGLDPDEILTGLKELGIDPESDHGRQLFAAMQNRHGPGSLTWTMGEIASEEQLAELRTAAVPWLNQIVEILVAHGCRLDQAASYLVKAGREDLLNSARGLDVTNALGETALTDAVREGAVDRVRKLLELGADPNARNTFDQSPLERVPMTRRGRECGRMLVEAGADVNARSPSGLTELEIALRDKNSDKVQFLLELGADVRVGAPVLWAVRTGDQTLLQEFLQRGADPNAALDADDTDWFAGFLKGTTPLMRAAAEQPLDVLQLLLEAGADPNAQDRSGRSAADLAIEHGRHNVAEWLQAKGGAGPEPQSFSVGLLVAAERGDVEQVRAMLDGGADPNVCGEGGMTPLILAAREGHHDVVEMLLKAGADVNGCSEPGYCGGNSTALRCAVVRGHTAVVKSLLEAGADTSPNYEYSSIPAEQENTIVPSTGTALHDAVRYGLQEIVELLLAVGADVNAADDQDETPLVTTVRHQQWQLARRLLAAGARKRDRDGAYLAPLDFVDAASQPEFAQSIRVVEQLVGTEAEPLKEIPGLVVFTIAPDGEQPSCGNDRESWQEYFAFDRALDEKTWRILDAVYDDCLARGHLLLLHKGIPSCGGKERRFVHLIPTADKYAALALYHVRGNEVELSTADILSWLREFERDHPFRLRGAGFDVVDLEFTEPLTDPASVAQRLVKFCPDLIEQNFPSWESLIQHLATKQRIHLWWD